MAVIKFLNLFYQNTALTREMDYNDDKYLLAVGKFQALIGALYILLHSALTTFLKNRDNYHS